VVMIVLKVVLHNSFFLMMIEIHHEEI